MSFGLLNPGNTADVSNHSSLVRSRLARITIFDSIERRYPLRCAFLAWLCCEEFFDSIGSSDQLQYHHYKAYKSSLTTYWPYCPVV